MKSVRAFRVLLTCVLLPAACALLAQPREPDAGVSDAWSEMYADRLSDEETRGANPCPRPDRGMEMHPRRKGVRIAMCVGRVKSRVVTSAWANGLDEHGVPLPPDAGARKQADMELWLRRLVGKFRIEGEFAVRDGSSQIHGSADCFGIGGGVGVSCAITADWEPPKEGTKDKNLDKALDSAVHPLVLLFGINPRESRIRVTVLDFRAIRMEGFLVDDAVIFDVKSSPEITMETMLSVLNPKKPGLLPLVTYTWSTSRVAVKPGGDVDVQFIVQPADILATRGSKEFDLKLRRESRVDAGKSGVAP